MESTWIYLVVIYAFLKGGRECMKKAALKKSGANEILFFYTLIGFIMTLPFAKSAFALDGMHIFFAFIKSASCCIAWLFSLLALKRMSVSLYSVMDLGRMVFSTALGVLVLGEAFTLPKAIGMVLVITGLLLVNLKKNTNANSTTLFTLIAVLMNCFFNAISGTLDKVLMKSIEPVQLQFWFMFFMTVIYGCILLVRKEKFSFKTIKTNYWIPIMSISLIVGDLLLFEANASPQSQVTLMTLIKQSSVVVSVLSGWLLFKEKDIPYKLFCTAIVVAGILVPLFIK
ncbi:MAG: EamA family transporter [Clostridia bacterium]|nr:EamA family transporter [Clostridia bacterium]